MSSVSSQRASSVVGEGAELLAADELIRSMLSHTNQDRRPLADKEGVQMPQQLLQWAERSNKCEMITQKVSGCPCDLVHISPILARANDGSKGDRVRQALVGSGVTLAVSKDADIGNKKRKVGSTVR
ncbi:hypothetical protein FOZ61_000421 [Perkinsus olseni]|uniref:Uncharacterized protein n=1 Tax=Perkinsus olseni TaxID=32597 RepID=A0A7J6KT28_PEROL|nr:hypothetical protein FOZ61_000421 [Perkinsus olseni]